ncbi:MAG: signal peptidase II [Pseudomonadaceae bacterium]|nr:signal peptidase II [Pseudomonadaceae bacterium]
MAKPFPIALILAGLIIAADQATKAYVVATLKLHEFVEVLPFFSWIRAHNSGAAWSFLADAGGWQRWFFVAVGVVFCAIVWFELRQLPGKARLLPVAFGLLLGGAIGNMIDRALQGYVVDFVLVHYGSWSFPAFNVADSAITIGAILFIASLVGDWRRQRLAARSS